MTNLVEATIAIREHLDELERNTNIKFEIMEVKTIQNGLGWVFSYNTREYVNSRNPLKSVAGNSPIIFEKATKLLHNTGTAQPVDYYVEEFVSRRV